MGKNKSLSAEERAIITKRLSEGASPPDIAKELQRDTRTIKKAIDNVNFTRKTRSDIGKSKISPRDMRKLVRVAKKMPLHSSKAIFDAAGVGEVSRQTRCTVLKKVARVVKPRARPLITERNKQKRVSWAKKYMKLDFSKVIFTDECRATLDGPDGWSKGWICNDESIPSRLRRQQGGGGVMFWAAIVGEKLIGPFRVPEGVKMNSEAYVDFLTQNFLPWYRAQSRTFKMKCVFMHDNAPAHASRFTMNFLTSKNIKEDRLMEWPPSSPDLNCIENLWSIIKSDVYQGGKQYLSKDSLWEAIKTSCSNVSASGISKLTLSMDDRLVRVIEAKGDYINM